METLQQPYYWKKGIGTLVGIIGFISAILGIYVFYFQNKGPNVTFEVTSNTNVLDINANLSKLDITYNNESLKTSKQNLRIVTVRVKNYGNESVLKDYYDLNDPLGLLVSGSKIVENPEIISTSNAYLKRNLRMKINNSVVLFNDLILDPDQSFTIKLLVLHPSNITPLVSSVGKIAGQNIISVITIVSNKDKSYLTDAFSGSFISQSIRTICYGLLFILFIVLILYSTSRVSDSLEKWKRKKLASRFKANDEYTFNNMDNAIFDRFVKEGSIILDRFLSILQDETALNQRYIELNRKFERHPKYGGFTQPMIKIDSNTNRRFINQVKSMLSDGLLLQSDDKLSINVAMLNSLTQFLEFLKLQNYVDSSNNFATLTETITNTEVL